MNISDTIVEGTFRQWEEGSMKSVVHLPGTHVCFVLSLPLVSYSQTVFLLFL